MTSIQKFLLALVLACGFTLASAQTTTQPTGQQATQQSGVDTMAAEGSSAVRFAHLAPDAGVVDIFVDGQLVFSGGSFGFVSQYFSLPEGTYEVRIAQAGAGAVDTTARATDDADAVTTTADAETTETGTAPAPGDTATADVDEDAVDVTADVDAADDEDVETGTLEPLDDPAVAVTGDAMTAEAGVTTSITVSAGSFYTVAVVGHAGADASGADWEDAAEEGEFETQPGGEAATDDPAAADAATDPDATLPTTPDPEVDVDTETEAQPGNGDAATDPDATLPTEPDPDVDVDDQPGTDAETGEVGTQPIDTQPTDTQPTEAQPTDPEDADATDEEFAGPDTTLEDPEHTDADVDAETEADADAEATEGVADVPAATDMDEIEETDVEGTDAETTDEMAGPDTTLEDAEHTDAETAADAAARGALQNVEILVIEDDVTGVAIPEPGMALVRIVHVAGGMDTIAIAAEPIEALDETAEADTEAETHQFDDLAFEGATDYTEVPAGRWVFSRTDAPGDTVMDADVDADAVDTEVGVEIDTTEAVEPEDAEDDGVIDATSPVEGEDDPAPGEATEDEADPAMQRTADAPSTDEMVGPQGFDLQPGGVYTIYVIAGHAGMDVMPVFAVDWAPGGTGQDPAEGPALQPLPGFDGGTNDAGAGAGAGN